MFFDIPPLFGSNRKRTILAFHGFNVSDGGGNTIGRLQPYAEMFGYDFHLIKYGYANRLRCRLCTYSQALMLAKLVPEGTIGVGHSHGCNILAYASRLGARFNKLILINPALNRDTEFGPHPQHIHVWSHPHDTAVRFAEYIPFSPWGALGAKSYTGSDLRVVQHWMDQLVPSGLNIAGTHSDVFRSNNLRRYASKILLGG